MGSQLAERIIETVPKVGLAAEGVGLAYLGGKAAVDAAQQGYRAPPAQASNDQEPTK